MTLKDTEFQDGSLTELEITEKAKISKSHLTFLKLNSEKTSKDYIKLKLTEVLDTDGVSELEVNTQRPQAVEVQQSVSKERRNDHSLRIIILQKTRFIKYRINHYFL